MVWTLGLRWCLGRTSGGSLLARSEAGPSPEGWSGRAGERGQLTGTWDVPRLDIRQVGSQLAAALLGGCQLSVRLGTQPTLPV